MCPWIQVRVPEYFVLPSGTGCHVIMSKFCFSWSPSENMKWRRRGELQRFQASVGSLYVCISGWINSKPWLLKVIRLSWCNFIFQYRRAIPFYKIQSFEPNWTRNCGYKQHDKCNKSYLVQDAELSALLNETREWRRISDLSLCQPP
jgi:hypothetical protein